MFSNWAEDIVFILIKNKIISIDERDVYLYGTEVVLLNICLLIIISTVSFAFDAVLHLVAFVIVFIPLRSFAGGYHAKTSELCMVLSTVIYTISLFAVKILPMFDNLILSGIVVLILCLIVLFLAPQTSMNNELSNRQFRRNKYIVRILLALYFALFILCYLLGHEVMSSITIFIGLVGVLLVVKKSKG